jgi:hypothetical protein
MTNQMVIFLLIGMAGAFCILHGAYDWRKYRRPTSDLEGRVKGSAIFETFFGAAMVFIAYAHFVGAV